MKNLLMLAAGLITSLPLWAANPLVEIKTNQGTISAEIFVDKAPKTAANFLQYVKDGFFDGTIFHRVIDGFMIQGGGFTADMRQKPTRPPVENEAGNGLRNSAGTLAMARTSDPNSATAQFFINLVDNDPLDRAPGNPGYTVFGRVTQGLETVAKIAKQPTGSAGMFRDVPRTTIVIESVRLLPDKK